MGGVGGDLTASRIVVVGAVLNVCLIGLKFGTSMYCESDALLAEAHHSLFDLVADLVTFLAVRQSSSPSKPSSLLMQGLSRSWESSLASARRRSPNTL